MDVPVELEILRKGHTEVTLDGRGDPADGAWAQSIMHSWLEGEGWAKTRWKEFVVVARRKGEYKIRSRTPAWP